MKNVHHHIIFQKVNSEKADMEVESEQEQIQFVYSLLSQRLNIEKNANVRLSLITVLGQSKLLKFINNSGDLLFLLLKLVNRLPEEELTPALNTEYFFRA